MANPFYIEPFGGVNVGAGLTGLADRMERRRMRQEDISREDAAIERAQKKFAEAKQAATTAYQSGDPDQIASVVMAYPEISQALTQAIGFKNQATKNNMIESLRTAVINPDKIPELIETRKDFVRAQGGDPTQTEGEISRYEEDPGAYVDKLKMTWAALDTEGYNAWRKATDEDYDPSRMGKTEVLPDGTTVIATSKGPAVWSAAGERLSGEDAAKAIREAQEFGIDIESRRAGGRKRAEFEERKEFEPEIAKLTKAQEAAQKRAEESIEKLADVREQIGLLDEVVSAIEEGASTGAVSSKLPSIRAASQRLDNLQRRLGLNVISNTTFGALSEGELSLALDTALPTGMKPEDLKQWAIDKRNAQEKLANYLEDAAIFLSEPGNTTADWIKMQRQQQKGGGRPDNARQAPDGNWYVPDPNRPGKYLRVD